MRMQKLHCGSLNFTTQLLFKIQLIIIMFQLNKILEILNKNKPFYRLIYLRPMAAQCIK